MKIKMFTLTLALSAFTLSACSTTTQMTSGASYLARSNTASHSYLDREVRAIAAVEPDLHFPARIGLARIENGKLTNAPAQEMVIWGDMAERLGAPYGEIIPVSPFIANMVRPSTKDRTNSVVADIRRASARQHLDYVLTYEVTQRDSKNSNGLALADLTILGLYVLPSRSMNIDSSASAILLDVRNGYPYGTATAFANSKKKVTALGSSNRSRKARKANFIQAVENLSVDVETMMEQLWMEANKAENLNLSALNLEHTVQ